MNTNEIIAFGQDINVINEFNLYLRKKIQDDENLTEVDYQNLSLSHQQNEGKALSAQLLTGCGYSSRTANYIAHYSCKTVVTYLQLVIEGLDMPYSDFWKLSVFKKWVRESDAYMLVKTEDIVQAFPDLELVTNLIEDWQTFLDTNIEYGQLRINVQDGDGSYSHSLPSYHVNDGSQRKIADVSYRKQGIAVTDAIKQKDFKYFLYLV
jgi:hypothetical protein